jgi:dGTPase
MAVVGGFDRLAEEHADQRDPGPRDRDRILYTSALRRLASVTQVVSPSEGHIFHNRLTHTLEVGQIARRLAEKFLNESPALASDLGGIDPDITEAAALAHDLGHPPFGHVAEEELDRCARDRHLEDGFEGNAQSFRILVHGAAHRKGYRGLNLTRRTLNAVLKYPWLRDVRDPRAGNKRFRKFGAYAADQEAFDFARAGCREGVQSAEAEIMEYADDIGYSIHDLDDFYRAGLIPLALVAAGGDEYEALVEEWKREGRGISADEIEAHRDVFLNLLKFIPTRELYRGTLSQRAALKAFTSAKIGQFVRAAELTERGGDGRAIRVPPLVRIEIEFLQRLVWHYVIRNPRLATQQHGQREVVRRLFEIYLDGVQRRDVNLLPPRYHEDLSVLPASDRHSRPHPSEVRLTVDIVSGFTDNQAVVMYRRLLGSAPGSVSELLHG